MSISFDKKLLLAVLAIVLLGVGIYVNVIPGKFIWDDDLLIRDNLYIRHWSGLGKIFTQDIGKGSSSRYGYYRPLQLTSHLIEYALWKDNPAGYHIVNIALHCLTGIAVFFLIRLLYSRFALAFIAALLFVSHPIQTETVSYISDRADLLCAFFLIVALIFYIRHAREGKRGLYPVVLVSFVFALLSKENALIFVPAILLYHYSFREKIRAAYLWPLITVTLAYLALRATIILEPLPSAVEALGRSWGFMAALAQYLRLIFFPFNLHFAYGDGAFVLRDSRVITGIVLFVLLLVYAAIRKRRDHVVFFSIGWFLITLAPSTGIYPRPAFYMAEHALHLPSIGFVLLLAYGIIRLSEIKSFRRVAALAAALILTFYSAATIQQNTYWLEPVPFYLRTIALGPLSPLPSYNLANIYRESGDRLRAVAFYKKAIQTDPTYLKPYLNLAIVSYELGDQNQAFLLLKQALELDPENPEALYNMAVLHYHNKEYDLALACRDKLKDLRDYKPNQEFLEELEYYRKK